MTESARYGYLSPRGHRAACLGLLALAGVLGGLTSVLYSALFGPGGDWPYDVLERRIVSDVVEPGGELGMRRLIEYHQEDCWRQYTRRAVSKVQTGDTPGMVHNFDPVVDQRLPTYLSNNWQTWTDKLPEDFTCGPATLVETVTAYCTLWQKYVRPLRKPDIMTGFSVACTPPG